MRPTPSHTAITYVLRPRLSVGPVLLGHPVPDTPAFGDRVEVQVHKFMAPEVHLAQVGLRLHPDQYGVVREVTVVEPGQIEWESIVMLGRSLRDVVRDLRRAGIRVLTTKGIEGKAPEIGLGIWADSGIVTGVTASDPDNPMPVPTTNDILAAYGIKPLPSTDGLA